MVHWTATRLRSGRVKQLTCSSLRAVKPSDGKPLHPAFNYYMRGNNNKSPASLVDLIIKLPLLFGAVRHQFV